MPLYTTLVQLYRLPTRSEPECPISWVLRAVLNIACPELSVGCYDRHRVIIATCTEMICA